jgi:DNA-directed RNA polymerase specialized sigma24 family protein
VNTGTATPPAGVPGTAPTEFNVLFTRAYPAVVGFLMRVLDRHRQVPSASLARSEDLATEALARARVQGLSDSERSLARIFGWTADLCLPHLVGHPGRVPLPADLEPSDLLPEDMVDGGAGDELRHEGLPLDELQVALMGLPRRTRRVGVACLGAGLGIAETASILGLPREDVRGRVRRIGTRLADRRRVDPGLLSVGAGPNEEHA